MKKFSMIIFLLACAVFFLIACGSDEETSTTNADNTDKSSKSEEEWEIVLVPKDDVQNWFTRMGEGAKRFAEETGLNAYQRGPAKVDAAMQVQVIEDMIAQGVDAICVVPVDPNALEPVLGEALDRGIVVVTHEASTLQNTMYNIEAFDNTGYGAFIMDNLAEAMGEEGVYTTMVGGITISSHNEWADAAVARQKEKYPNMQLLEEEPRIESGDNQERSYERAKELFKKYPNLKGVLGTSSQDAPGIARAIDELGLIGKKFTVGTGMPNESRQYLKTGALSAATLWDPADAGYALLTLATKVLREEQIENGVDLGVEGFNNMQFQEGEEKQLYGDGWLVVTEENVDSLDF